MRVELDVLGSPAPKGSGRAILIQTSKGPEARFIPSSSSQNSQARAAWESAIRTRARQVLGVRNEPVFMGVPVLVAVIFRMRRPAGHWGKKGLLPSAPTYPATSPDIDKLMRSTLDALTGLVFDDDSRVVAAPPLKVFARPGNEGAQIIVDSSLETIARFAAFIDSLSPAVLDQTEPTQANAFRTPCGSDGESLFNGIETQGAPPG